MPTTMAFEFPRKSLGKEVVFVGPLLPLQVKDWEPPTWWNEITSSNKPIVHVTQGTYATKASNLVLPTIRALAGQDLLLIVTTPDPEALAKDVSISKNIKVAKFIPHQELLKYTSVMVTNGGYGGVLTALALGVPLVCAGLTEDKAGVNSRVAWFGAGIDLKTDTPSEEQVRKAVLEVLGHGKYGEAARRVREDFGGHDGPGEAAEALEKLVMTT